MNKDINLKNTKNEILEAYNEALTEVKKLKQLSQKQRQELSSARETVKNAPKTDPKTLEAKLNQLKDELTNEFDNLSHKLTCENEKLLRVQEALSIQEQYLQESYDIKQQAESLESLILANKKTKFEVETELNKQREQFKIERTKLEQQNKDHQESLEKTRAREEEDYQYQLKLKRSKEQDAYDTKRGELARELTEKARQFELDMAAREKAIKENEGVLNELKVKVASHPEELNQAVIKAVEQVRHELSTKFDYQTKLQEQSLTAKISLLEATNLSLKEKIDEQQRVIDKLSDKEAYAQEQVQNIALKAIEGAQTGNKYFNFDKKKTELESA